jgi:hypothetical protein
MKQRPLVLRPWLLPLIVCCLVVPVSVAFIVAGPGVGLAVGALTATALIVIAATRRPEDPIVAASSADERHRVLLVTEESLDDPASIEELAEGRADAEILVLVPARNRALSHWLSDVGPARVGAQERLAISLAALAAARLDAHGRVGDPDLMQSVEDTLADFGADEVVLVVGPGESASEEMVADMRKRLQLPLSLLLADRR